MMAASPLRLGFPVKLLGRPDIKSNDSRRWQNHPHLRVSLEYLDQILDHLARLQIRMYRMSSDLAPYLTHPDLPQFHGMIGECRSELAEIGRKARERDIRLSFHPSQFIVLNSPDPVLVRKSIHDIATQAEMLDCMELGPEAVIVIHVGGIYDDRASSLQRWVETWQQMPEHARRRLVLEHDDLRFSAAEVLWVHEHTGVRLIFDHQHFWCFNPERLEMRDVLARILATWPAGQRPKIHFSSPRTEMRAIERRHPKTRKPVITYRPPIWTGHASFCHPFEFIQFMRVVPDFTFDVMLESKSKDVALLRLRQDLLRYAPDLAVRFGVEPKIAELQDLDSLEVIESE